GRQTDGAAHQARPAADDQAQDLRWAVPPAPGAATRGVQAATVIRRETVADTKTKKTYYMGTGRGKTSVARVRLCEGSGQIVINGRGMDDYFTEVKDRNAVTGPLEVTEMRGRLDLLVKVQGGGISGQAGAVCQGVARALKQMFGLTTAQQEG